MNPYVIQVFLSSLQDSFFNVINFVLIKIRLNIFRSFPHSTYFLVFMQQYFIHFTVHNIIILLLSVKFLSCHRSCLRSLVCLLLTYLEPSSPRTFHSSVECPGPCISQVFYSPFRWFKYLFLSLPAPSLILDQLWDEVDSPILFLMWPSWVESALVGCL